MTQPEGKIGMNKRTIVLAAVGVLLVLGIGGALWVRSVFANDTIRTTLAAQISSAIGQPVAIGSINAGIFPRVTVKLGDVTIGQPPRITAKELNLGTNLRALLSRQIVNGTVQLDGVRVELPLPPLGTATPPSANSGSSGSPIEIVSIDEVKVSNVEVVSSGRTLRGDIEAVPHGNAVTLRRVSLAADDTSIEATGEISDLAGPAGRIEIKAGTLDLGRLLDFFATFSSGSGMSGGAAQTSAPPTKPSAIDLTVALNTERALLADLALEKLTGTAHVKGDGVVLDPVDFGVFGGQAKGSIALSTAAAPTFRLRAALSSVDVAAAMAYAGSPGMMTGRFSGQLDLAGDADAAKVVNTAHGTVRADVKDGTIKNLGLVRTIIAATSKRADSRAQQGDERFNALGATLNISGGTAQTNDLRFESPDVLMSAAGGVRLDRSAINLKGQVQLSEALTQQAGSDLVRYTQEQGRVTLPVTVTGSAAAPSVHIDMAGVANRAIKNQVDEQVKKGLGSLFKK